MSLFLHTLRLAVGLSMLAASAALVWPFADVILTARRRAAVASERPSRSSVGPSPVGLSGAGGVAVSDVAKHAIPDPRPMESSGDGPWAAPRTDGPVPAVDVSQPRFVPPPAAAAPLPPSGLPAAAAPPALDVTYRSTMNIPPPPLLDAQAAPPLAAGWVVHGVPRQPAQDVFSGPAPGPEQAAGSYVVRDGDDLTGIALRAYGHAGAAGAIWDANRDRIPDPGLLPIGLELRLPPAWMLPATPAASRTGGPSAVEPGLAPARPRSPAAGEERPDGGRAAGVGDSWLGTAGSPAGLPVTAAGQPGRGPGAAPTGAGPRSGRPDTVRVGPGDSLESIAWRYYGDRLQAKRLWLANRDRLRSPDLVVPGVELRLP